jgi:hypothetical protein
LGSLQPNKASKQIQLTKNDENDFVMSSIALEPK